MDVHTEDLHTVPTHIEVRATYYLQQADLHIARWVAHWSIAFEIALIIAWSLQLASSDQAALLFVTGPILIWAASLIEIHRLNAWEWTRVLLCWACGPHRLVRKRGEEHDL